MDQNMNAEKQITLSEEVMIKAKARVRALA
jgi:hypothetical protein